MTLLVQGAVPIRFWSYAFVLNNESPYECWYVRIPDYHFLRVFDCLAFSYLKAYFNVSLNLDLLCFFFGYAP